MPKKGRVLCLTESLRYLFHFMLLAVVYLPRRTCALSIYTENVKAEVNTNPNLTCTYSPKNAPVNAMQWYYGKEDPTDRVYRFVPSINQRIAYKHLLGRSAVHHIPGVLMLSIDQVNETDDGKYKCELEDDANAHDQVLDLRTYYQATITAPESGKIFDWNITDVLRITITSNCTKPPVEFSWSSDGVNTTYEPCLSNQYATTTISTFTATNLNESFRLFMNATHPSFSKERESREYIIRVPDVVITCKSTKSNIGKDVSIQCEVSPSSTVPSTIKWYYTKSKNVSHGVLVYDAQNDTSGEGYLHLKGRASHKSTARYTSLVIKDLAKSDTGTYSCEVWIRNIPYPRASLTLSAYDIVISGTSAVGYVGKEVSMKCDIVPLATFVSATKWYYAKAGSITRPVLVYDTQDGTYGTGYLHLKRRVYHAVAAGYTSLAISRLRKSDEGTYSCEVWIRNSSYPRASLNLSVNDVGISGTPAVGYIGREAALCCDVLPLATVISATKWFYKEAGSVKTQALVYDTQDGTYGTGYLHLMKRASHILSPGHTTLIISRLAKSDEGTYLCEVWVRNISYPRAALNLSVYMYEVHRRTKGGELQTHLSTRISINHENGKIHAQKNNQDQVTITAPESGTIFDRDIRDMVQITATSNCTKPPVKFSWSSDGVNTTYEPCPSNPYATKTISTYTAANLSASFRLLVTATHPSLPKESESREYVVRVPDVVISGTSAKAVIGSDVSIRCMVNPRSTVPSATKWYYIRDKNLNHPHLVYDTQNGLNGKGYLHLNGRAFHTLTTGYTSLTISSLVQSDAGIYLCEVVVRNIPYPRVSLNLSTYADTTILIVLIIIIVVLLVSVAIAIVCIFSSYRSRCRLFQHGSTGLCESERPVEQNDVELSTMGNNS